MKIPNKRALQKLLFNHSSGISFQESLGKNVKAKIDNW